ncbi:MAG: serine hydrolase [Patescibacteria group bacterium]|nr:serine hydrolase [Patescibacteria group bacterium]MDE1945841.1 serine hydrolase [Patescibacteria group bacterium]
MEKKEKRHIAIQITASIILLAAGFAAGYAVMHAKTTDLVRSIRPVHENNFNYQFVFPLLKYDFGAARPYLEDKDLEQKINAYVQNAYENNRAESISVYEANLLDNDWAGVNADAEYHPASMMKVLIMIAYYRQSQLDPAIMNQRFIYTEPIADQANAIEYNLPSDLVVGQTYNVRDLIALMIERSDNGAETLLLDNSNQTILNDIYHDLGIEVPTDVPDFTISPRTYSAFIRILYNTTYLTDAESEAALSLMASTTFTKALAAGVPADVTVAHKYGEHVDTDAANAVTATELHDCGIVYAENPYQICVMTKGYPDETEADLAGIIKDISALVYRYKNSAENN